ncbi:hypothetical protein IW261DRAFT_1568958 [Armillaria novae-zelandiae]|uniref:Uncharacterized protein n=1 Tax=Armillaria novae-zelandiae TaxID=153914 RepID=A0AA39NYI9_9AGAR|nr:hypothetical protein IW261DRAFT_1568958 [Armillaria novae-zelandiae]
MYDMFYAPDDRLILTIEHVHPPRQRNPTTSAKKCTSRPHSTFTPPRPTDGESPLLTKILCCLTRAILTPSTPASVVFALRVWREILRVQTPLSRCADTDASRVCYLCQGRGAAEYKTTPQQRVFLENDAGRGKPYVNAKGNGTRQFCVVREENVLRRGGRKEWDDIATREWCTRF